MRLLQHSFLLFCMLSVASCSGQTAKESASAGGLKTGMVIPSVPCASDPSCTFALYLPTGYEETQSLPVWILFDPMANGALPVGRYRELGERYGVILMGSNDSRNGQSLEQLERIAAALETEARTRFRADSTRLYLIGFSGGARVSCILAGFGFPVKGVIGCGAGFPETAEPPLRRFDYAVIAGEADPNLSEVILQDQAFSQAGWRHQLMVVPGGHAWPLAENVGKAWLWLQGKYTVPPPPQPLAKYYQIEKEATIQNEIMSRFILGDTLWMKHEIKKLKLQSERSGSRMDSLMALRMKGFLGLLAWSKSTSQLKSGLLDQAFRSLTIYRMADPDNPAVDSLFNIYYEKRTR